MYADYTFYTETYLGSAITEADFPRLSLRASEFLDYFTRGKARDSGYTTELAKACCAVAEAMQNDDLAAQVATNAARSALENGELKSESVGSYSRTFATTADYARNGADAVKSGRVLYAWIATEYLLNTGLLYRGGC